MGISIPSLPGYIFEGDKAIYSTIRGKHLTVKQDSHGYFYFRPTVNKRRIRIAMHRIIAELFIGRPPVGHNVNHKNGIKWDNRPENLEWVTQSQNVKHAYLTGLRRSSKGMKHSLLSRHPSGESHANSKLNIQNVKLIRWLTQECNLSRNCLARIFGVTKRTITIIVNRKTWKHVDGIHAN